MTGVRLDAVIVTAAISAGIHAALAPDHFRESVAAGVGFVAATLLLVGVVLHLTLRPADPAAPAGAVLVFFGLLVSYALAVTTGLPVLHPDVEPVDTLGLFTKAIEAVGLVASLTLLTPVERKPRWNRPVLRVQSRSH